MRELIIVTDNPGKLKEYQDKLKPIKCIPFRDVVDIGDIEETGLTFKKNAFIKANAVYQKIKRPCLADDSGLIVDALPNDLGVHSKRFSIEATGSANNQLLLKKLMNHSNRKAHFYTCICLMIPGQKPKYYHGKVTGEIIKAPRGKAGFGYDPLFLPKSSNKTLAEMTLKEKNLCSHRAKAIEKLVEDLSNETHRFL